MELPKDGVHSTYGTSEDSIPSTYVKTLRSRTLYLRNYKIWHT